MKTLHLTNAWHEKSGGIAAFYRALIDGANRRGHQIRLIVPAAEDRIEPVGEFGKIYHLRAPQSPLNPNYRTIYPSSFLVEGSRLQTILADERPDLIEICDKYTLNYLGALLRVRLVAGVKYRPVVVGLSQERMDDNVRAYFGSFPLTKPLASFYMKWLYFPFFDHHIANSEYTAAELRAAARGHLVPRGTWIRPMGVDLGHLSPHRRRREYRQRLLQNFGASENSVLLLYAGRLVPEKNIVLLFDLVSRLGGESRDYRLLVVGDGIERETWKRKCEERIPGKVLFLGHIGDSNVLADIYANADLFVHPNPREPFGIAPLEAMASGLPLVAPNAGGITSYANLENAWTVPADVQSFASAVDEVVCHPEIASMKVERALQTANQYRWEAVVPSFLDLYGELIQRPAASNQSNAPVFYSTPAKAAEAALTRGAARIAMRLFQIWSRPVSRKKVSIAETHANQNHVAQDDRNRSQHGSASDASICA